MTEPTVAASTARRDLLVEAFQAALDGAVETAEAAIQAMTTREQDDLWRGLAALLGTLHDDHGWGCPCGCPWDCQHQEACEQRG